MLMKNRSYQKVRLGLNNKKLSRLLPKKLSRLLPKKISRQLPLADQR
jgi:hypothetical protein